MFRIEKHRIGPEGSLLDEVESHAISAADVELYGSAAASLSLLKVPVLLHAENPHERLFFAFFDGTGNDVNSDGEHATNVGKFAFQLLDKPSDKRIFSAYVAGPGTQPFLVQKLVDGAIGYSYDGRLERMYRALVKQAAIWGNDDPEAQLAIISAGFSRGAEQAAGFTRMVHERGIQTKGADGTHQLIPPGQIPQVIALFDPVGTGHPHAHDRRLPPSVVSGFQIYARDERRNLFPATQIIRPGMSADGRFLGVVVPGAHSDIGGGYRADGLSVINGNLMTDFINAHSDVPLLEHQPVPLDPSRYVISHPCEHALFEAKRGHVTPVTAIGFGKGAQGEFCPAFHVMQAFDGNVDDARTRWASFDASQAVMQSVEQTIAPLEATNEHLQQRQLGREHELARQPDVGLSMRM